MEHFVKRPDLKVGIVTLPLWGNYGGILQAYGLREVCERLLFHAKIIQITPNDALTAEYSQLSVYRKFKCQLGRLLINCCPLPFAPSYVLRNLGESAITFCDRVVPSTRIAENDFQASAFIVGSDQVWRRRYVGDNLPRYFLSDFSASQRQKSVSYAASFGTEEWGGSLEETKRCRELLQQFKAVSVRELSGIRICKEVFGVEAVQMPDPTLLATLDDYERIIISENTCTPRRPFIASYVLDDSGETSNWERELKQRTGLCHQRLVPKSSALKHGDRFYCTVPQWLRYMRDCEAVVTDSFHGCVFSIIYNKPFVCLGNEGRGMARFDTLLKTFGLEDRLVLSREPGEVLRVLHTPIDWERVNAIHESERQRGLDFLRNNLYDDASLGLHE